MKIFLVFLALASCTTQEVLPDGVSEIVLPMKAYAENRTSKAFGEWIDDRFSGYHVGDDVEILNKEEEVPIVAIAEGTVELKQRVSGYGGFMLVRHFIAGKSICALYGHLDLDSTSLSAEESVAAGDFLAYLGDHESEETDGERKHLHFGLYDCSDEAQEGEWRLAGYEQTPAAVANWINPQNFFEEMGVPIEGFSRFFKPEAEPGGDIFSLRFEIPVGWEVEYIPSLEALNVFTLSEVGTARERSQILIRYFDASEFLTLSTVDILSTEDIVVGREGYEARRYEIAKKADVPNFRDQPAWRNERHIVTDFHAKQGYDRYYVVATNPKLDMETVETFLKTMEIISGDEVALDN